MSCVTGGLPKLIEFDEKHAASRDHYAIIAFNLDDDIEGLEHIERKLVQLDEKVFHGKRPRFPMLFDRTRQTQERFGVGGFPTIAIVDPEGKLDWTGHRLDEALKRIEDRALASEDQEAATNAEP